MKSSRPLIAIVGPTAVGKSFLAEEVALRLGSPVVSVDAMQVYRGMDIGTAKVPVGERRVPLLMVDMADPGEAYSVQRFKSEGRAVVDGLLAQGTAPVLCGGTGLYLNALIDEMDFPSGETGGVARSPYERLADEQGAEALWDLLNDRDPESAKLIHPNNVRRVVRALEMGDEGVSYAAQNAGLHERAAHYPCRIWGLTCDRTKLHERIERRVDAMFADGLVEEVRGLLDRGLADALTAKQAIGYAQVMDYFAGQCTLAEARERIIVKTRQYAKRQLSWFRHDSRVRWIDLDTVSAAEAVGRILGETEPVGVGLASSPSIGGAEHCPAYEGVGASPLAAGTALPLMNSDGSEAADGAV